MSDLDSTAAKESNAELAVPYGGIAYPKRMNAVKILTESNHPGEWIAGILMENTIVARLESLIQLSGSDLIWVARHRQAVCVVGPTRDSGRYAKVCGWYHRPRQRECPRHTQFLSSAKFHFGNTDGGGSLAMTWGKSARTTESLGRKGMSLEMTGDRPLERPLPISLADGTPDDHQGSASQKGPRDLGANGTLPAPNHCGPPGLRNESKLKYKVLLVSLTRTSPPQPHLITVMVGKKEVRSQEVLRKEEEGGQGLTAKPTEQLQASNGGARQSTTQQTEGNKRKRLLVVRYPLTDKTSTGLEKITKCLDYGETKTLRARRLRLKWYSREQNRLAALASAAKQKHIVPKTIAPSPCPEATDKVIAVKAQEYINEHEKCKLKEAPRSPVLPSCNQLIHKLNGYFRSNLAYKKDIIKGVSGRTNYPKTLWIGEALARMMGMISVGGRDSSGSEDLKRIAMRGRTAPVTNAWLVQARCDLPGLNPPTFSTDLIPTLNRPQARSRPKARPQEGTTIYRLTHAEGQEGGYELEELSKSSKTDVMSGAKTRKSLSLASSLQERVEGEERAVERTVKLTNGRKHLGSSAQSFLISLPRSKKYCRLYCLRAAWQDAIASADPLGWQYSELARLLSRDSSSPHSRHQRLIPAGTECDES
ncbi:hypothetical protein BDK51DRAFT_31593 [Blyttiomyces helicus]|uniref:Uncharacterized protein n=1 Tax=Blyttiomyces helicus TaxID=388810 RepID=A0A4P9WIR9_9FUNG|nr:hypothetical protein BDK51DRAFT_31593 [Blyttiomyces helicus]|eukprot:RKO92781.1 hypothetical protein BDK51DRAFT_31593 [Blyttiomyces helicus]